VTKTLIARRILYASHEKGQRKSLDAQVRVKKVMTIVPSAHLKTISLTRGMVKQIWVFVREIVTEMLIVLQASTVSSGASSTPCLDAKVRGQVEKTTAFPKHLVCSPRSVLASAQAISPQLLPSALLSKWVIMVEMHFL